MQCRFFPWPAFGIAWLVCQLQMGPPQAPKQVPAQAVRTVVNMDDSSARLRATPPSPDVDTLVDQTTAKIGQDVKALAQQTPWPKTPADADALARQIKAKVEQEAKEVAKDVARSIANDIGRAIEQNRHIFELDVSMLMYAAVMLEGDPFRTLRNSPDPVVKRWVADGEAIRKTCAAKPMLELTNTFLRELKNAGYHDCTLVQVHMCVRARTTSAKPMRLTYHEGDLVRQLGPRTHPGKIDVAGPKGTTGYARKILLDFKYPAGAPAGVELVTADVTAHFTAMQGTKRTSKDLHLFIYATNLVDAGTPNAHYDWQGRRVGQK